MRSIARISDQFFSRQESGVRRLFLFILPTPHSPTPAVYSIKKL
ncbi:hypothetical protein C789_792 [Microcystis aeruginosa FACHB-905 = DIANCHI905]|uniref:Uncharacterized protein n=1 Tax=Microcystis aeruginosa PCC 7806SL TaxID=1903187 RepID=A0AB33BVU5_MICA7|nr:hypothetical protein BH695_4718 [Microcystis aeruginosa PCC 7806SL]ELS49436.1 hypothetical protein C789_792 [Microcystis aeruginosa FACHB-905 = DIANCHI905]